MKKTLIYVTIIFALLVSCMPVPLKGFTATSPGSKATGTSAPVITATSVTSTATSTRTATVTITPTHVNAATATYTLTLVPSPTITQAITGTPDTQPDMIAPFRSAPACLTHDPTEPHGIWDSVRGCHYDHEHGQDPRTSEVANTFPGFDLLELQGGDWLCHTNPSGPMECTHKHGGLKWNVQLQHPQGCKPHETATVGVNGSVIEYHAFGNYAMELEAAIHSAVGLLRQCVESNPTDYGYVYINQHVTYGEVCVPYQGSYFPFPHDTAAPYDCSFGQYLTVNCIEFAAPGATQRFPQCRRDLALAQRRNVASQSNWSAKITGTNDPTLRPQGSTLLSPFFRIADAPQSFDFRDRTHPYTFVWICSADGGVTFKAAGCDKNNSTSQMHEIQGEIPAAWDNLAGFDTDTRVGRITAEGYVTTFGELNQDCTAPGVGCHPIKLVKAFVGKYGSVLVFTDGKGQNIVPLYLERDIYFCGEFVCTAAAAGSVPSGWIGENN